MFEDTPHTVHIGRSEAPQATPAAAPGPDWIPQKFHAVNDKGFDLEASARKLAESYSAMERRAGADGMRPESPDLYQLTVPEHLAEGFEESPMFKEYREKLHGLNLSQEQFDGVMGVYFDIAPRLAGAASELNAEQAEADLRRDWKDDKTYKAETRDALEAFNAFADPRDKARMHEVGNNPVMVRLLARLAKELGEAGGITPHALAGGHSESVQQLLTSEAAGNPKHPDYAATRQKIDAYYAQRYGNAPAQFTTTN